MNSYTLRSLTVSAVALLGGAQLAHAQIGDTQRDASLCASSLASFERDAGLALQVRLSSCGERVIPVLSAALRKYAGTSDTVPLAAIMRESQGVRGEAMLQAAATVLTDRSASINARLAALGIMFSQYRMYSFVPIRFSELPNFSPPRDSQFWCTESVFDGSQAVITRFGANVAQRIAAVLDQVINEGPEVLSTWAACLRSQMYDVPRNDFDPAEFVVKYWCDNNYTVRFTDPRSRGEFEYGFDDVRKRTSIKGGEQVVLAIPTYRPFKLYVNGTLSKLVENGRKSCVAEIYRKKGEPLPRGADTLSGWARPIRK